LDRDFITGTFRNIHTNWTKFCQSGGGINDLPNGSAFTLLVEDPRLSSILTSSSENPTTPVTKQRIQPPSERSNLLFDRKGVRKCLSSAITEAKLNELKSTRVGTIKLKHYKVMSFAYLTNTKPYFRYPLFFHFGTGVQRIISSLFFQRRRHAPSFHISIDVDFELVRYRIDSFYAMSWPIARIHLHCSR
jgi:hypothetical protein